MELLVANLGKKVRKEQLQGREYLVAPVSMLLEGVFAGSAGAIFYPGEEIEKSIAAWNHRPVTVGHPALPNGSFTSGCTKESLEKYGVGMLLNSRYDKKRKRLLSEAWFDVERLKLVDGGVAIEQALINNTVLEVSTGLLVDGIPVQNGEHNGKSFAFAAKNFKPDHLAILLNEPGACSVTDGAGLLVNKASSPAIAGVSPVLVANLRKNASLMSIMDSARAAVRSAYGDEHGEVWVEDMTTDRVVFTIMKEDGVKYYSQKYAEENGSVKLVEELMPVARTVTYEPLVVNTSEKENMNKEQLIDALGADFVANMKDEQLAKLQALVTKSEVPVTNSAAEFVKTAPESLRAELQDALVANQKIRASYIDKIVANAKNKFSAEELANFDVATLEKLADIADAPAPVAQTPVTNSTRFPIYAPTQPAGFVANSQTGNGSVQEPAPFTIPSTFSQE